MHDVHGRHAIRIGKPESGAVWRIELMSTDPRASCRLKLDAFDDRTAMQCVWRSFFDVASLSTAQNASTWGGG